MTPERWRRVEELYDAALMQRADSRDAFLADACAGDADLRREVESLLTQPVSAQGFLKTPAEAPLHPSMLSGKRLGIYEVHEQIGVGGMGEVYRARDTKLRRDVAIKILPRSFTTDPDRMARFQREARMLASLNHPNIGAIYGLEEADGIQALVLELIAGQTLTQRIARGPLPLKDALRMAVQILEALDNAHEKGIVHRDLKPTNIKITPDGVVKILDFGLARVVSPDDDEAGTQAPTVTGSLTREGVVMGTPAYMSPEQARGHAVDKRTDIWAFGCVLYEMLSGRTAFGRQTVSDTLAAVLERTPDWSALPRETPPALRRLLPRCVEKDLKQRIRDVGDVRIELDEMLSGAPVAVEPYPTRRGRDRFAWPFAVASLAALGLGVFAARPMWTTSTAPPTFSRVIQLTTGGSSESGPAISPDGKWIAYLSNAGGPTDVWVRFLGVSDPVNLTASTTLEIQSRVDIGGLAISPDGSLIAFDAGTTKETLAADFDSWVIPAPLGGAPRKLVQRGRAVRWSPDGSRRILFVRAGSSAGDALWVADDNGGSQKEIVPVRGGMHIHWPAWSHDGRHIYFHYSLSTQNREPVEIYRVSSSGGPIEAVVPSTRRAVFPNPTPDGRGLIYAANPTGVLPALWWRPLNLAEPTRLTTGVGEYAESSITPDGQTMISALIESRQTLTAFSTSGDGSSVPRRITDGSTGDQDPVLSPGGDRLVFSSSRSGFRNLWTARPDGTMARALTSGNAFDERPAFSPDGRHLAFVSDRGGQRGIWMLSADGGIPERLIDAPVIGGLIWSSDGSRIVYAIDVEDVPTLHLISVAGKVVQKLSTPGPAAYPFSFTNEIVGYLEPFPGKPDMPAVNLIKFVRMSGEPVPAETLSLNLANGFAVVSTDGRHLAGVVDPGGAAGSIWVADLDRRTPFRKVADFAPDVRPRGATWSHGADALIVGTNQRASRLVLFDQAK